MEFDKVNESRVKKGQPLIAMYQGFRASSFLKSPHEYLHSVMITSFLVSTVLFVEFASRPA